MAVPQQQKKVGAGGCIVSLVLFVLSCVVFFGGLAFALSGVSTVINDINTSTTGIADGETRTVNVSASGVQSVLYSSSSGTTLPIADPTVTIKDPSGNNVPLSKASSSSSGSSGATSFRVLGTFNASTPGAYEVSVDGVSRSSSARVYVLSIDVDTILSRLAIGFGVGFTLGPLLLLVSLILAIVWLVRRSRNNKTPVPPYQGGYGAPPPGPPGGYGAPPPGPPGGYGAPPPGPPPAPGPPPQSSF